MIPHFIAATVLVLSTASAALAGGQPGRGESLGGRDVPAARSTVRRVCVQMGVPTYRQPEAGAAVADGDAELPSRLGGGEYVQRTGRRAYGYVSVRTLKGVDVWIPERMPESGQPSLCVASGSVMRVCRTATGSQEVPVQADFAAPDAPPTAWLRRGSRVQLWGYFEERGRWTFVETHGTVGFVRSAELCHARSMPPGTQASERFKMIAAPAHPDCYQSGRERAAGEIRRIVIHNSEATLERTIALFQDCEPERPHSAHVGIDRDGTIYRFVEDKFAAFHTGGNNGGFNSSALGVELIAYNQPGAASMTPQQERALRALLRFWTRQYHITIPRDVVWNSTRSKTYNDLEFWRAPLSIHRLVSADRRTDCPNSIWANNAQGDEEFFHWRRTQLAQRPGGSTAATRDRHRH
ncbi:MAG: peptidoglycan recognition family protein [Candidatus Binatia bacterium]